MEEKNPMQSIEDIYKEYVAKEDEKGYSETFKKASQEIFDYIETELNVIVADIEYQDGYFIFAHGTNSIAQFKINKCPGWLFGIWWEIPEDESEKNFIKGDFFAQYEEVIDKFKPSASKFRADLIYYPTDEEPLTEYVMFDIIKQIKYIIKEPYLAFHRDYIGYDYNEEYVSRFEAWRKFKRYKFLKKKEKIITQFLDKKAIKYVKRHVLTMFTNAKLLDRGEYVSPRYQPYVSFNENANIFDETGCYCWFDDSKSGKKAEKKYEKFKKRCKKIGGLSRVYWCSPVSEDILVINEPEED